MRADPLSMGPPAAASGDAGSHPGVPRPRPPRGAAAAPRDRAHALCRTTPDALSPPSPSIPGQGSFQALLRFPPLLSFPPLPFSFFGSSGNSGEELPTAENAESAEARLPKHSGRSPLSSAPRFSSAFLPFFSATPCLFSSAFSVFSGVRLLPLKSRKILFLSRLGTRPQDSQGDGGLGHEAEVVAGAAVDLGLHHGERRPGLQHLGHALQAGALGGAEQVDLELGG